VVAFLFCRYNSFPGQLGKTYGDQQDQVGCQGETRNIDHKTPGEGHDGLYQRIHRQGRCTVGTDEEHIKGVCFQKSGAVGDLVHGYSDQYANCKYRNCFQNCFVGKLYIAAAQKIHTNDDHRAVADHSLDIDADGINEHRYRIEHNADAGKNGIGGKVGIRCFVNGTFPGQSGNETYIHRCGAELEGKGIPGVIEHDPVSIGKCVIDLFVNLQYNHSNGSEQYQFPDPVVGPVPAVQTQEQGCGYCDCQP